MIVVAFISDKKSSFPDFLKFKMNKETLTYQQK